MWGTGFKVKDLWFRFSGLRPRVEAKGLGFKFAVEGLVLGFSVDAIYSV